MTLSCSKKISALLRGITSKDHGAFYCLNCLYSFATGNKRGSHKNVCENEDICNVVVPYQDAKILEFSRYQTSDKALFLFMQILNA